MGIVIRQSIRTVFITYSGVLLGFINILWLYPLVLNTEQVGLTKTLINVAGLFATLASLSSANIPSRFFPYFKDAKEQHHGILFFILVVGLIGFSLFVVIFLSLKDTISAVYLKNAPLLIRYYYYLIPFTLILLLSNIMESYNTIQQRSVFPSYVREVQIRILTAAGLIIFFLGYFNFDALVYYIICSYLAGLVALLLYTKSQNYLFLKPNTYVFRSPLIKQIATYSGFLLLGSTSAIIIGNVDSLMLSAYSGLRATGIYTIAFYIATIIEIPRRSLSQVLVPLVSEANKNEDIAKLEDLYKKSSINQLIIGSLIFIGIWSNIDGIFALIPNGAEYSAGKWVVFYLGLGKLFDMATGINAEIVGTSKFYKADLMFNCILGFLAIFTNLWLIPKYGLTGAAMASALSVFIYNTIRFSYLLYVMRIQPFSFNTVKGLLIIGVIVAAVNFIPFIYSVIIDMIIRSLVIAILFAVLVLTFNISEDINKIVYKVFALVKSKIK
jgi:O-antigen/teichoic acid export membrane protein